MALAIILEKYRNEVRENWEEQVKDRVKIA
jgi:hypothetical protein